MTTAPFGKDGNYSDEDFKAKVNADLANNMGNLLNRSLSMLVKYFDGEIKDFAITSDENELALACKETKNNVIEKFNDYQITEAVDAIIQLFDKANKYVNEKSPWSLAKEEETLPECAKVLYDVLETIRYASVLIYPFTPNIAQKIWEQLSCEGLISEHNILDLNRNGPKTGQIATNDTVKPVFLRVDSEFAGDKKKK
jgi:methionyl-tRNA synthetase